MGFAGWAGIALLWSLASQGIPWAIRAIEEHYAGNLTAEDLLARAQQAEILQRKQARSALAANETFRQTTEEGADRLLREGEMQLAQMGLRSRETGYLSPLAEEARRRGIGLDKMMSAVSGHKLMPSDYLNGVPAQKDPAVNEWFGSRGVPVVRRL